MRNHRVFVNGKPWTALTSQADAVRWAGQIIARVERGAVVTVVDRRTGRVVSAMVGNGAQLSHPTASL